MECMSGIKGVRHPKFQWYADFFAVFFFAVFFVLLMGDLLPRVSWDLAFVLVSSLVLGLLASDFISGLVHWAADTWGSVTWPLIGPTLLLSFREHHKDPLDITTHGFLELNGNSCLVALPVLIGTYLMDGESYGRVFVKFFFGFMLAGIALTNSVHSFAHQKRVPKAVGFLQRSNIILSRENHKCHHTVPFVRNYCITTGWMNGFLNAIGFFPKMERAITHLTGAIPRYEDLKVSV